MKDTNDLTDGVLSLLSLCLIGGWLWVRAVVPYFAWAWFAVPGGMPPVTYIVWVVVLIVFNLAQTPRTPTEQAYNASRLFATWLGAYLAVGLSLGILWVLS